MTGPAVPKRTELLTATLAVMPKVERVQPTRIDVANFDNASDDEPAAFPAYYLLGPGTDEVIAMVPTDRS